MKSLLIFISIFFLFVQSSAQTYTISGGLGTPYVYGDHTGENLTGSGIDKVYLFNTLTGATIKYTSSATSVIFYRYKYSQEEKERIPDSSISITSVNGNSTYTVSDLEDGYGYFAADNNNNKATVWIIDYSLHLPTLGSIETIEGEGEYKCTSFKLYITKTEDDLIFYTINGGRMLIQRKYTVTYNGLQWSDSDKRFVEETLTLGPQIIGTDQPLDNVPLINTTFKLSGDQFAEHFNIAKEITSKEYQAVAVKGRIVAEQDGNTITSGEDSETTLGGSAPVTIDFYGRANEDITHFYTWYIYNKEDPDNYIVRYTDKDIKYTFDRTGEFTVQLEIADRTSTCVETMSISVSTEESELKVPNYFSPGGATHREFKVKYKSIIKFKCTIFNRWGVKIYQWNDPSKGWDGRYNGSYVSTGVYYYVIEYTTGDGKKRTKGGDINVLRRNN